MLDYSGYEGWPTVSISSIEKKIVAHTSVYAHMLIGGLSDAS